MNLSIDIQEDSDYLVYTVTGKWVTHELESFIDTASSELKKRRYRRILVDMSLVSGPPPEMDRYDIGKYIASVLLRIKIAVVYRKVLANNFFEDTAVNRGAWIKVFPDKQTALQWLMEGQIDKSSEDDSQW